MGTILFTHIYIYIHTHGRIDAGGRRPSRRSAVRGDMPAPAPASAPVDDFNEDETLCELLHRKLCFWQLNREYCFGKGSRLASWRDLACAPFPELAKWACMTDEERRIASFEDALERKEYLGTLTEEEARALRRRRMDAAMFIRRRALAEAPEEQRMEKLRRKRRISGGGAWETRGPSHVDEASVCVSDDLDARDEDLRRAARRSARIADERSSYASRSSYSSYSDDSASDSYYSDSQYSDTRSRSYDDYSERSSYSDSYSKPVRRRVDAALEPVVVQASGPIVGKDIAYAGEGTLSPGLQRWEEYIQDAEIAGAMMDEKYRRKAERFDGELDKKLLELAKLVKNNSISDHDYAARVDFETRKHEQRVLKALEDEERARERSERKRNKLSNLDPETQSRLFKRWARERAARAA